MEAKETKDESAKAEKEANGSAPTPDLTPDLTPDPTPDPALDPAPLPTPLPPKVERALAQARATARGERSSHSGRWLALVPVGIGALLLLLMMPRATAPDGVPVPRADHRVTAAIASAEEGLAREAEATRLPGDILAVGSAVRDLNDAVASDDKNRILDARRRLDAYVLDASKRPGGDQDLIRLRALQTRLFINAIAAWEGGEEPKDFIAAGGAFIQRAEEAGWVRGRHVLLDDTERRVAFKTVWNGMTHLERDVFVLTLDEERALYAFYIAHPHVGESARLSVETMRRDAVTPELCTRARAETSRQESLWLAEKIKKLAAIDPQYPGMYAVGIAYWRAGRVDLAIDAFNLFIEQHPDGPYSLRAKNHLKAALTSVSP